MRLYLIPGLTAKEIAVQIPGGVVPRNIRGACLQLRRDLGMIKRGSPYKKNRIGVVYPLYITPKGTRALKQHLQDIYKMDLPKRGS